MKFKPTNLQTALDKQRGKSVTQEELLSQVSSIFNEVDQR